MARSTQAQPQTQTQALSQALIKVTCNISTGQSQAATLYVDDVEIHTTYSSKVQDALATMMMFLTGYMSNCQCARMCMGTACPNRVATPFTLKVDMEWVTSSGELV